MPFQYATRTLVSRGQTMIEINVGPPVGFALLAEADHARIVKESTSAAAYLRAVMQGAAIFARDGFRLPEKKGK